MNLDHSNSNSPNLGDDHDSHITPVTTSGSANTEASAGPSRENSASLSGGEVHYPRIVWHSEYLVGYESDPGPGFLGWARNWLSSASRPTFVNAPVAESPPVISTVRCSGGPRIGNRSGGSSCDEASNGSRDNSVSWNTVRMFCRFGGLIVPRGARWIYVGGDAKIVNVSRNVSIDEFVQKIAGICGQFYVVKYKLPEEDIDALVSVASSDDLENMIYEYDGMVQKSSDKLPRLKVFLFSSPQTVSSLVVQMRALQDNGQRQIEEEQEFLDRNVATITRTESIASNSTGHEKVEEVEGIVDGTGGGITRKEEVEEIVDRNGATITRTESMQDSDLSGTEASDSTGHDKVEEVKGIVDGNGRGITRKEEVEEIVDKNGATITRTESMQDSDLSGTEASDSTGHEKVEEVKGIVDGNGGGIRRKEKVEEIVDKNGATITRTESMQDSDLSGTEASDSTGHEKVEEVKGIVDGNGGGIRRKEKVEETVDKNGATITRTESMQDSDLSGTEAFDSTGHEKVEEVKGIVDGNGGGIMRKESVASDTSQQISNLSGEVAIDISEHEQVYFEEARHEQLDLEEVNEIVDKIGGDITRRESMASATSIQELDLSSTEAIISTRHEQVDIEEVKGILDGNVGGITRTGGIDSAASMHNSDLSRTEAIDSSRHEQVDVEEVEGNVDGNGGGITRRESMACATPKQSLDLNATEAVDSTDNGQVDIARTTSSGGVSSENNFAASQEIAHRLGFLEPKSPMHVEPATDPSGIQAVSSRRPVLSTQPIALVQQKQQQQAGLPPCAPYFQAYIDPQQKVLGHTEYVQYPNQMGFPSQHLETAVPVFTQHQKRDNVSCVTPNQSIPVLQMPTTPNYYANPRPIAVQPVTQPQEVRLEQFQEENMYRQRLVQSSGDQTYGACHAQVSQSHTISGGCGWHQARQIEQVPLSYGSQQQVALTEGAPRFEEGNMCEKALLRTHSDILAQGQRESPTSTSNFSPVYHSLQPWDKIRGQPVSTAAPTNTLAEGIIKYQVTEAPPASSHHLDHEGRNPEYDEVVISQHVDERTSLQRKNDHNHLKASVPECILGGPQSPNSVFMGTTPRLYQENATHPVELMQHRAKEEVSYSTAVSVASVGDTSFQVSDHPFHNSSKEHSGELPSSVSKEGTLESFLPYDQLQQIDSRMENLSVQSSSEIAPDNEQVMSGAGNCKQDDQLKQIDSRMENFGVCPYGVLDNEQIMWPAGNSEQKDIMDNRAYQTKNTKPNIDNAVGIPQTDFDATYYKQNEVSYSLSNEVPYAHDDVPCSNEVTQPPLSGIDPAQLSKRGPPICELKHNASQHCSKVDGDVEDLHIDGNNYYTSLAKRVGDMQDNSNAHLSSEDPRNLQHDTHVTPPRPNEIITRNEAHNIDPFGDNRFGRSGEPATGDIVNFTSDLLTEDGAHLPSVQSSKEEHIKQELQAVAEGVAASVSQTCIPFGPAFQDSKFQNSDEVLHANKAEDLKLKLPEAANLGFPELERASHLQEIENSDIVELQELGSGTVGTVYYGKWRGTDVAIKRINDRCFAGKPSDQERMRADFWNEAIKLADLHHPNVVAFYGLVRNGPRGSLATVTEYMVNGSLRTVLQENDKNLDMGKRLLIAKDIAYGMEYLHGKKIVHFDLKSDNLLVNLLNPNRPVCKVGDLGLSKVKRQTLVSGGVRGTLPWMAPELLNGKSNLVSEKVDVFSFGIVLWELLTGEEPYRNMHGGTIIGGIVNNTLRPPVPDFCDPEWRSLMERCWSEEPTERPNFTEVVSQLQTMAANSPGEQQPISNQPQVKTERV